MSDDTPQIEIEQNIEQNDGVVIGTVGDTYVQQESAEFFQPDLSGYAPPHYISPLFTEEIINKMRQQPLIIIGGDPEIDHASIARHVVWCLTESEDWGGDFAAKEWKGGLEWEDLDKELRSTDESTVFLLPNLAPQQISQDPNAIRLTLESSQEKQLFVVASSSLPYESWKFEEGTNEHHYWYTVVSFSADYLSEVLRQHLERRKNALPPPLDEQDWTQTPYLSGNLHLQTVAETLKTPENIILFVELLCQERKGSTDAIQDIVRRIGQKNGLIRQWYGRLLPRCQLLAVALYFFDGLLGDQFFAALEQIVLGAWRARDPNLAAFDYYELSEMRAIFNAAPTRGGEVKLESRSADYRHALLNMMWESHRRYIMATLPYLTEFVHKSVRNRGANAELYGTESRTERIRAVISVTISDLGIKAPDAIQPTLLNLAADESPLSQAVAASAMARWRAVTDKDGNNHDELLFEYLDRWHTGSRFIDIMRRLLGSDDANKYTATDYIQATVAMIVAFAAEFDYSNKLHPKLLDLFVSLSSDLSKLVRERFKVYTLPRIVTQHWKQLDEPDKVEPRALMDSKLQRLAKYDDLQRPLADALANRAYRLKPKEVWRLLTAWQSYCEAEMPTREQALGDRERLFVTVVHAYGYLPDYYPETVTVTELLKRLERILDRADEHPTVRLAVLVAIGRQAKDRFDDMDEQLKSVLFRLSDRERAVLVQIMTDVYVRQRFDLDDGGATHHFRHKNKQYPTWIGVRRPITEIEEMVHRWLHDVGRPMVQQTALEAKISFAGAFDQAERRAIEAFERQREAAEQEEMGVESDEEKSFLPSLEVGVAAKHQLASILAWVITKLNGEGDGMRQVIAGLIPPAMVQDNNNPTRLDFVLEELTVGGEPQISNTAARLAQAVDWLRKNRLQTLALALGGLIFLIFCCAIFALRG